MQHQENAVEQEEKVCDKIGKHYRRRAVDDDYLTGVGVFPALVEYPCDILHEIVDAVCVDKVKHADA